MSQKEYVCRYCGVKVSKYATICSECSKKLKRVRELKQILKEIKKRELQTNYDRIKNMSVNEMSTFLNTWFADCITGKAPLNVKRWLEQEVDSE
jgi:predicted amidophosphoribosyltransferase